MDTRQAIRSLLTEREVGPPQGFPDRTSFPDMPNYPIKYVDTDEDWIVRYYNGHGQIEVNTAWAEKLWNMDATRWGVSAWDAAIAHEAAHGWWEASGEDEGKEAELQEIPLSHPELGRKHELGPITVETPPEEAAHERAIETLVAFYFAPDKLNDEEKAWAQSVFDMI